MVAVHVYFDNAERNLLNNYDGPSGHELLVAHKWYKGWNIMKKGIPRVVVTEEDEGQFDNMRKNLKEFLIPEKIAQQMSAGINEFQKLSGKAPSLTLDSTVNQLFEANREKGSFILSDYMRRDRKMRELVDEDPVSFGAYEDSVLMVDFHIDRDEYIPCNYQYISPPYVGWDYFNREYWYPLMALGPSMTEELPLRVELSIKGLPNGVSTEAVYSQLFRLLSKRDGEPLAVAQLMALGMSRNEASTLVLQIQHDEKLKMKLVEAELQVGVDARLSMLNIGDRERELIKFAPHDYDRQKLKFAHIRLPTVRNRLSRIFLLFQASLQVQFGITYVTNAQRFEQEVRRYISK
jgi:hypothetical protein